jgi:formiminotetrahydrofolate cyclodeaminase
MNFAEISCAEFISLLGSKAPVPGGGGASALVGAVGTALGNMVGALTVGKKKYAEVEGDMIRLRDGAEKLQGEFLALVQRDAEVFEPLSRAYGMPRETEAQQREKDRVMEAALKEACSVPLEIMAKCGEAIGLHEEFAAKGSRLAVSDAGVGVIFCKAALFGASLNVYINTAAMKDRALAAEYNRQAGALLDEYGPRADRVFDGVTKILKKD